MKATFKKDAKNKKMQITRTFKAPLELVWRTWTEAELLEKWWAPHPYRAITKSIDFREGGFWLYYMLSPEGSKHWCRADYLAIAYHDYFAAKDAFCDEQGTPNTDVPSMHWKNNFIAKGDETRVSIEITFATEGDMERIIKMGFQEGFTAAHHNLDELLADLKEEIKQE